MAQFAQGKLEAFCGPHECGAQDDLEQVILDFIRRTKTSLDAVVAALDSEAIAQALLDAAGKGISIRLFMQQDALRARSSPRTRSRRGKRQAQLRAQWQERSKYTKTHRDILAALLRCGVDVKLAAYPAGCCPSYMVRDYRAGKPQGRVALLISSAAFTRQATHRNLNHAVIVHDAHVAACYAEAFERLMLVERAAGQPRQDRTVQVVNLKGIPVRIPMASAAGAELEIIKQLLKARSRVDFALHRFAGVAALDDTLLMLQMANIDIQGLLDASHGSRDWSERHWLREAGLEVFVHDRTKFPPRTVMQHSLLVVDDDIVILGSASNNYQDAALLIFGSPYALQRNQGGPVDHAACKALANFFRNEIERLLAVSLRHTMD